MLMPWANAVSSFAREAYSFSILFLSVCVDALSIWTKNWTWVIWESSKRSEQLSPVCAPWGFVLEVGTDCCRDWKPVNNRLLKAVLHLGCLPPSPQLREHHRKHMVLRNTCFLALHGHYTIELSALGLSVQTCSGLSLQYLVMQRIVRPHSSFLWM